MPEISGNALVMVIQAVDEKIRSLKAQIDAADEGDIGLADIEEEMRAYTKTAYELRIGYEDALKTSGNFPEYASLVKRKP